MINILSFICNSSCNKNFLSPKLKTSAVQIENMFVLCLYFLIWSVEILCVYFYEVRIKWVKMLLDPAISGAIAADRVRTNDTEERPWLNLRLVGN